MDHDPDCRAPFIQIDALHRHPACADRHRAGKRHRFERTGAGDKGRRRRRARRRRVVWQKNTGQPSPENGGPERRRSAHRHCHGGRCRTGTHRRSLVEARMRCCKRLGERVRSPDFYRQVAELQIRAFAGSLEPLAFTRALLNRCTGIGTALMRRTAQVCQGKGAVRPLRDLRNKASTQPSF